jgi:leucyl-tRNA synthetase
LIIDDELKIAVQVSGKLRWTINISRDENEEEVIDKARENVENWLEWKEIVKKIYVPWKIVNFVVK